MSDILLNVQDLKVTFFSRGQEVQAVRGVDLRIEKGQILGIVGESGSGKSVSMKAVLGLLPKNASISSRVMELGGKELSSLSENEYRKLKGSAMTMIFQDPMTALNPLARIGRQLEEIILRHQKCSKAQATEKAMDYLLQVGISMPEQRIKQYPHEFSGGMRQRVLIAMALACEPMLLIADEPTTALDVTIQAQILELLKSLNRKYNMSIALITHDMGVVASMCDHIVIMYGGLIMESGSVDEIFYSPRHPYTKALLHAIPSLDLKDGERLASIAGIPPSLVNVPKGCPFAERCEFVMKKCSESLPRFISFSETHQSACFLNEEGAVK